jgi:dienelactone hydrolase
MDGDVFPSTALGRDVFIQQYKDVGRSLDYLESRPDIDRARIGYIGFSSGAITGIIAGALEPRLKALVLLEAGISGEKLMPGTDPIDFAPRVK